MAKIAIIVGNPMRDSFSEALAQSYLHGAQTGGHAAIGAHRDDDGHAGLVLRLLFRRRMR